ncbi:MAG: glycoside hydrolase family 13 protein [Thermotogae bacterium]|nr:glycoside hydrolase family 13 protein [Thermotogota bacterium]MCL5031793.1 glycoside hydrolase family 13 protein [Thermotogota bacterium]
MKAYVGYEIFPDRFYRVGKSEDFLSWDKPVVQHEGQEYDFYGGNLKGIISKIPYLRDLGIEFIYITPIFKATTNHRYDCMDFFSIDPVLGDENDIEKLCKIVHNNGMQIFIDVTFNHVGSKHPWFKSAVENGKEKDFFRKKADNFVYWANVKNMPELNLENEKLKEILWGVKNSVLEKWIKIGVDGLRLDCAYELGYDYCHEITTNVKKIGGKTAVGEIWSYPQEWISNGILDGVMNYYFMEIIKKYISRKIDGNFAAKILSDTVKDCGGNVLLSSWNMLSSHDTPRIKNIFDKLWKLAVALQFTLPGSPIIYYGEEIGLNSKGDPFCREPMKWELASQSNETLMFYRAIISLFKNSKALNEGFFESVISNTPEVLAFMRKTDRVSETKLVVVNPTNEDKKVELYTHDSALMNDTFFIDHFSNNRLSIKCSIISGEISAGSFGIFYIKIDDSEYTPYKRINKS